MSSIDTSRSNGATIVADIDSDERMEMSDNGKNINRNTNDRINKIVLSDEVQSAIEHVLQSTDPLDQPDFIEIDYINQIFPNEQSLSNIDDVILNMEYEISVIDDHIRGVVRGQSNTGEKGRQALEEAQKTIHLLFSQITDIKTRAERTEDMVKEITRDIKQLDCAKKNLTSAITTLNHLHMLVGGVESLNKLAEKRLYGEILNPLQAITEVNEHFQQYTEIPQIEILSQKVTQIQTELAKQITEDFKNVFSTSTAGTSNSNKMSLAQLTDACLVVSVLNPKVKNDLLKWYINQQLQEYIQLFHENQDVAWLDKIDKRYAWLKRHLLDFEDKYGNIFPKQWEVSERITVEFCIITRDELERLMSKRRTEFDVKLLLFAIQKTQNFESLLNKRFTGETLTDNLNADVNLNPNSNSESEPPKEKFTEIIGVCFKKYLDIYTDSIDRNLEDLIESFISKLKAGGGGVTGSIANNDTNNNAQQNSGNNYEIKSSIYPSCADLFIFYKKCMVQCTQLSNEKPMYDLTMLFKKYLREYAIKILENQIPKLQHGGSGGGGGGGASHSATSAIGSGISSGMSLLTKDFQNLSTAAGQVIHNFLRDGEATRFTRDDIIKLCCILTTGEYCLETVQQLEDKLKEKVHPNYVDKIDLGDEKDVFHRIISNCIQLLVQDIEVGCDTALNMMSKIQWQNINNVGDQSAFVNTIIMHFKMTIPIIRDNLSTSRKYYTQFCHKFVNSFIPKYINNLMKLRPTNSQDGNNNILGCEQLLLDTHSIKTVLLDLPSIGSQVNRKAPASYTKVVVRSMTKAEMIIKLVMAPHSPYVQFVEQYLKLLPDSNLNEFHKVLDMKGLKRLEQMQLMDMYKRTAPVDNLQQQNLDAESYSSNANSSSGSLNVSLGRQETDKGRIKKLEHLIKNRLPN